MPEARAFPHPMLLRFSFLLAFLLGLWAPMATAQTPIDVVIDVDGQDAKQMHALLSSLSELLRIRKEGAPSLGAVQRLAAGDVERFARALTSEGFYAAKIDSETAATQKGYRATFTISTGQRYTITAHAIEYTDPGPASRPVKVALTGAPLNDSARGPDIVKVETDFIARLRDQGYPLARVVGRRAEVTAGSSGAKLVYVVESGPYTRFGPTVWQGNKRVRAGHLNKFIPWKPGEVYSAQRAAEARDELADTGLFTRVEIAPGQADAQGNAPVVVDLIERKPRTIAAGLSYSTNLGAGVTLSWENRNVFGRAEKVVAKIEFTEVRQLSEIGFLKPRIMARTDLLTKLSARREDDEAFRGKIVTASAALAHKFNKNLTGTAGVELSSSTTRDPVGGSLRSHLIAFPLTGTWSTIEDLLDPKSGLAVALKIEPDAGESSGPVFFTLAELTTRYHWPIDDKDRFIGGIWGRAGVSVGPGTAEIPPEKRFYAGGAGSVRGYGYRLLGPTDAAGKPIGGRSVLEGGIELRFPLFEKFSGAVFAEAGGVDETGLFTFQEGIRESAGIGARYATGIGPIRVDLAFPLDRRAIDDPFQIYVGLGQAF